MAPAAKKMKMDASATVAYTEPDVMDEIKRAEEDENDDEGSDDEETPMSIIAQFQSEDVRAVCMSW